jgi:hypothetical protein
MHPARLDSPHSEQIVGDLFMRNLAGVEKGPPVEFSQEIAFNTCEKWLLEQRKVLGTAQDNTR